MSKEKLFRPDIDTEGVCELREDTILYGGRAFGIEGSATVCLGV